MADCDWKDSNNFDLNFIPDDDSFPIDYIASSESAKSSPSTEEGSLDALLRDFGDLGTTPPRTRILRRNHHKKQKEKRGNIRRACKIAQLCHKSILRYSSPVTKISESLLGERDFLSASKSKRNSKRQIHRRRESERHLKLDFDYSYSTDKMSEKAEALPTIKVESSNRFLSLSCKLVKAAGQWRRSVTGLDCPKDRTKLCETISVLVKTGTCENKEKSCKRQMSIEEHLWQTELKDLIWLELRAWHSLRTPSEQDKYLCEERQSVPQLLLDILSYRFTKKRLTLSVQSMDSGVHFSPDIEVSETFGEKLDLNKENEGCCPGCLWLFCPTCMEQENVALHEVEMLLSRLEFAESLYPSSRAFALENPIYMSNEFIGRVKAMCSWYNITRHHRLKLLIIGRQLLSFAEGNSVIGYSSSTETIEFNADGFIVGPDLYNVKPITTMGKYLSESDTGYSQSYRKFIEDVLKIKGLKKALYFLEKIHQTVLRKARIALEKPSHQKNDSNLEESECRRYGHWSEEARSLNLPSFIPAFLFISRIPIDVVNAFLLMRLEIKPDNPSVLSIRQLIRELKEGLRVAVVNKERHLHHIDIALVEEDETTREKFKNSIVKFDESLTAILELYLNYLIKWVMLTQKERIQKNLLEDEWKFVLTTAPSIPKGEALAGRSFCKIATNLMHVIQSDFLQHVHQLIEDINSPPPDSSIRQSVLLVTRSLLNLCQDVRDRMHRIIILSKMLNKHLGQDAFSACNIVSESVGNLKCQTLKVCEILKEVISLIESTGLTACETEDADKVAVLVRFREVLLQFYKFGFEYYREVYRLLNDEAREAFAFDCLKFSQSWLKFVINYCEKGRGVRPRWAHHGLEFLVWTISPDFTQALTDKEFECLKLDVEKGVAHIMGTASPTNIISSSPTYFSTRTRSSSPRPSGSGLRSSMSTPPPESFFINGGDSSPKIFADSPKILPDSPKFVPESPKMIKQKTRQGCIISAINKLDSDLDKKRRNQDLIGTIVATPNPIHERNFVKPRPVNFTWQRGIKIGQGRFGKVYTAVNNDTGELMAMKEISTHPNDIRTIRNVAIELKIIEGIQHPHLVRYYGTEIHRDELLIFMELCTEGTLESLIESTESGLPEGLVRRYTSQLVSAIEALHQHSIVHRDIKTANIFLTAEGNSLKVGDFGSAVKIKAHTTVPGELKGFVGTQAYMAPEVFMNTNGDGHGRAADIWSLGCVIIEMASGKRPWHEFDSNYQIMFKVGMGSRPEIPSNLSDEGKNFVLMCLRHSPKQRPTATELSTHTFLKIDLDEESVSYITSPILEDYLKLGVKR